METTSDKITLNLDDDAEVNINGYIESIEYTQYNFHVEWEDLANLRVAEPEKQYPASVFQSFLPMESVSVGGSWQIEPEGALILLQQLHPQTELLLQNDKGDDCGIWACLRAYNDELAEIVFRIHAKFILNRGTLTPTQFAGNLIIDRIQEKIVSFKMCVPQTTLNFAAGWRQEDGGTYTEIGYCPQIELSTITSPPIVEFSTSITQEAAERAIISHFYKFHKINWVSLEEALEIAPAQQKPVHVVSIDGPLFDESC